MTTEPSPQASQAPAQQTLTLDQALQVALAHHKQGTIATAEELYEKVLQVNPQQQDALHLLGVTRFQRGRLDEAEALVRRALAINPQASAYHNSLGRILLRSGQRDAGLAALREALRLSPQNPEAFFNLAEAELSANNPDEAARLFEQCLVLKPIYPEARFGLANAVRVRDGWAASIPHYQIAAAQAPDSPTAQHMLCAALMLSGHLDDALRLLLKGAERWPQVAEFHLALGSVHFIQGRLQEAIRTYERALELAPNSVVGLDGLVETRRRACDWRDDMEALERRLVERFRHDQAAGLPAQMRIFTALYTAFAPQDLLAIARANAIQAQPYDAHPRHGAAAKADGRLRVGYLIADVRDHPNAHNTLLLYGLHDRSRYEVFTYSWGIDDNSEYRRRIMRDSEHFVEMRGMADEAIAQRIAADGIQVLVDLMGHTGDNRIGVLARRAAPIQVNYLGFPCTSGAPYVDYIIGDAWVTPQAHAGDFSEAIVTMPWSYQCNSHREVTLAEAPPRRQLGLPDDAFVYCCFNSSYKIEARAFGVWMGILDASPGSVLWLFRTSDLVDQHLRDAAARHGIDPNRLVFAPYLPRAQHMQRMQVADLFLDTDRYNAHTTASDALWAGIPLLTVPGPTFASRVAAGLLHAAGLDDAIQPDWDAYAARAVALAGGERDVLDRWKAHLRARRATLPVFDTPALVRALEAAYSRMVARMKSGEGPAALDMRQL